VFVQAQQSLCHPDTNRNYSSASLLGKLDVFRQAREISLVNQSPKMKKVRAEWGNKTSKPTPDIFRSPLLFSHL